MRLWDVVLDEGAQVMERNEVLYLGDHGIMQWKYVKILKINVMQTNITSACGVDVCTNLC